MSEMKLLIYNCGLLRMRSFPYGPVIFSNPPYVNERFKCLSRELLKSGADIIALQEIYESGHVQSLLNDVKETYPYSARQDQSYPWQFHNGLLFLSKHPINASDTVRHAQSAMIEYVMGCKAMQSVEVQTPFGPILFVNMHTTAGGTDPESADRVRQSELQEAIDKCRTFSEKNKGRAILLGDMNMGPDASKGNYDFVLASGYQDAVIEKLKASNKGIHTWDTANVLNASGVHSHCPPQRCDHVFLEDGAPFEVTSAELFMTESIVETKKGLVTLSDHYGIQFSLKSLDSSS